MRYLRVKNGRVSDITLWNKEPKVGLGWSIAPDGVQIGWKRDSAGVFTAPPIPAGTPRGKRSIRNAELSQVVHVLGPNRSISARHGELPIIRDVIDAMKATNTQTVGWLMVDGSKKRVTLRDLEDTLLTGQSELLRILDAYEP